MLDLPWYMAPRDLPAGEVVTLGTTTYEVAADSPAGTLLGVATDGRFHHLPAKPDPKPEKRRTRGVLPAAAGSPAVARRARPPGDR